MKTHAYLEIGRFLNRLRVLEWVSRSGGAVLRLGVAAAVILSLNVLVVEGIRGALWIGFALGVAGAAVFWVCLLRAGIAMARPLTPARAARRVEESRPEYGNDITSSLALGSRLEEEEPAGRFSPSLVRALIGSTGERVRSLRAGEFVDWAPMRIWGVVCILVAVPTMTLVHGTTDFSPSAVRALVDPTVYWPLGKMTLTVSPGSSRMAQGGELAVQVNVSGPRPGAVSVVWEEAGERGGAVPMERMDDRLFGYTLSGMRRDFRYRVTAAASASPWYNVRVVEPPTAGNFEVLYTFPAYTALEPRRVTGSGNLEALRGTSVKLEFATNKPLGRGRLFLGENEYEILSAGHRRYRASLFLNGERSYRLELADPEGFKSRDRLEYSIRYLPDAPPKVEIIEPRGEIDLGPLAQIPVAYRVSDDYGVSRLSLVYRDSSGREVRTPIFADQGRKHAEDVYYWDVGALSVQAGTHVPVFLEAADNDSITGPKVTLSNSFVLRVPDPEIEHRKTEESIEEFVDDLVDLLADSLNVLGRYEEQSASADEDWEQFSWEDAADNEKARQDLQEKAALAEDALDALEQQMYVDPLSRPEAMYQLGLIERQLDTMSKFTLEPMEQVAAGLDPVESQRDEVMQKTDFLEKYAQESVEAAEQMVLMAEQMQREQHMADVKGAGSQMLDLQDEILESLEDLSGEDREAVEQILDALDEMERMMQELGEALGQQSNELPEEFVNSDALQKLPLQEAMDSIRKIRDMLNAGDLEGAKQAARELLKTLGDLLNRLQEAGDDFENRAMRAIDRLKRSTLPNLDSMIAEQRKILENTENLEAEKQARIEEALRKAQLPTEKDRERADEAVPALSEREKNRARGLSAAEGDLRSETEKLAEEVAALRAALPFLQPQIGDKLEKASGDMEKAEELLGKGSPGGAVPAERSALAGLMDARNQAGQSLRNLEQMQGFRRGMGKMALFSRRPGGSLQGMGGSTPRRGTMSGGRLGLDVRSFRIPGKDDYEVPRIFRQEILESLREGYPVLYEDRIKDYFHRISE